MVEWTFNSAIITFLGIMLPILIAYYFLRDWKKSFFVFLGYLLTIFSIKNEPSEKFNILFPIFTLIANGLGFIMIFSQFIGLKKVKKLRLFK